MSSPPWQIALEKRQSILTTTTNAVRLIDGRGDGMEGIQLETYADRWLLCTKGARPSNEFTQWLKQQGRTVYHKHLSQQEKDSPTHLCGPLCEDPFLATENSLNFEISFQSGYSQGIFLDQRLNRQQVRMRASQGSGTVLNTFAYTGAFSVAAAMGGAITTTLDLSQPYLQWAKRNFVHNNLDPEHHHFCKGDTFHWLRRFQKSGRKFHGIILDPPTFSRDENGKVFRAEKDFGQLAALAHACLEKNGWILCCTNCFSLSQRDFETQIRNHLPKPTKVQHGGMPSDFSESLYLKNIWLDF